jgi:hypothetical protein
MMTERKPSLLGAIIWEHPITKIHARIRIYFFATLFLVGIIYWIGFFNSGALSLNAYDWVKEDAYLNTLRFAEINNVIPWLWSEPFYHNTDKFLANPEIVLTPDIFILQLVPNSVFIIMHVVSFYAAGFWGSFLLAKELNAKFVSFFFFWLVFNFNGHISAQIAIGHFQWTGYFLIPFFFVLLLRLSENAQNVPAFDSTFVFRMALLLGILFLNGSVHLAIICSMFLITVLLFKWTMYRNIIAAIFMGFLLGLNRLLPAALWFPSKNGIGQGYPSFNSLLDAFTALRLYNFSGLQEYGIWGWWEYNIYIGFMIFIIFLISAAVAIRQNKIPFQPYLLKTAGVFLLLSLGNVYNIINILHLPFMGVERVPSRFIVMPFVLISIISMAGLNEFVKLWGKQAKILIAVALPFAIGELYFHFSFWRIQYLELSFQNVEKPILSLISCSDQMYIITVCASWVISSITVVLVIAFLYQKLYVSRK